MYLSEIYSVRHTKFSVQNLANKHTKLYSVATHMREFPCGQMVMTTNLSYTKAAIWLMLSIYIFFRWNSNQGVYKGIESWKLYLVTSRSIKNYYMTQNNMNFALQPAI